VKLRHGKSVERQMHDWACAGGQATRTGEEMAAAGTERRGREPSVELEVTGLLKRTLTESESDADWDTGL
jgi:hypothetical protein